jgi:hypothetical protein
MTRLLLCLLLASCAHAPCPPAPTLDEPMCWRVAVAEAREDAARRRLEQRADAARADAARERLDRCALRDRARQWTVVHPSHHLMLCPMCAALPDPECRDYWYRWTCSDEGVRAWCARHPEIWR